MDITRSNVLSAIRRCSTLADLARSDDEALVMRAGLMPKDILYAQFGLKAPSIKLRDLLQELTERNRIVESPTYYRANPNDRTRPIATHYDIEKPHNIPPRSQIHPTLSRKDRLALWYAAAKGDLSGSMGDSTALFDLLRFWRTPAIQKAWKTWLSFHRTTHFKGKLPEDAE
jgi:hypothetical protein